MTVHSDSTFLLVRFFPIFYTIESFYTITWKLKDPRDPYYHSTVGSDSCLTTLGLSRLHSRTPTTQGGSQTSPILSRLEAGQSGLIDVNTLTQTTILLPFKLEKCPDRLVYTRLGYPETRRGPYRTYEIIIPYKIFS